MKCPTCRGEMADRSRWTHWCPTCGTFVDEDAMSGAQARVPAHAQQFAAMREALIDAVAIGKHDDDCGWWDSRHKPCLMHFDGVCDCWLSRAALALDRK